MPVTRCIIQGAAIRTLEDLYDQLVSQLPLPSHFGRNLDALWDVLTADLPGPVEVVWEATDASQAALGQDFDRVTALLREVARQRNDFTIILKGR